MGRSTSIGRAIAVLAVGGVLAATLLSPVGAAFNPTKKRIKSISRKVANKVVAAENAIVVAEYEDAKPSPGTSGYTYNATTTIASLTLPAGVWAYRTDFWLERGSIGPPVGCRLLANGTIVDKVDEAFPPSQESAVGVSMQHASNFASGGMVEVRCDDGEPGGSGENTQLDIDIVAIQGSSLT